MAKKKPQEAWMNIRIKAITVKRLRLVKAQMEVPTYDDVINAGLNLIDEENK